MYCRLTLNGWDDLDKLTGVTRTDLTYLGIEDKEQDAILRKHTDKSIL